MKKKHFFLFILILTNGFSFAQCTFNNPIKPAESPDPYVIYKDGYYYFMVTTGDGVWIHKSDQLQKVGTAVRKKVWSISNDITGNVWAPELHYLNGKWYIYSCGSVTSGCCTQRMFVLEGDTQDPLGTYTYKGLLDANIPAIDESVWQDETTGKIYMTWSQWDPDQSIFICEMVNPTTMSSNRIKLSSPTNSWERNGWPVNEGPFFIKKNNVLHIVFSVSGCSTPDYALASLTCRNGNYLNASSWTKSIGPIFKRSDANGVYGPGHHCFIKSSDGCEDWIVYHAKSSTDNTNSDRSTRIQKFSWDSNDNPVLGEPVRTSVAIVCPSTSGSCIIKKCTDKQTSFKTLIIPGTIEAEDFDAGCPEEAYHDSDTANIGSQYRSTQVDIETTKDIDGGYNIGWLNSGEWLEYTVNVKSAGKFNLEIRVASNTNNNQFHVEFNGINKAGVFTVNNLGGVQTWFSVSKQITLNAGSQIMKLAIDSSIGGFNINKLVFSSVTSINDIDDIYKLNIYPNPTKNEINIQYSENLIQKIEITDIQGRVVYSSDINSLSSAFIDQNIETLNSIFSLNISYLQSGIYFLKVINNKNSVIKKFVKQ